MFRATNESSIIYRFVISRDSEIIFLLYISHIVEESINKRSVMLRPVEISNFNITNNKRTLFCLIRHVKNFNMVVIP